MTEEAKTHDELQSIEAAVEQAEYPFIVIQFPALNGLKETHGPKLENALQTFVQNLVTTVLGNHREVWINHRLGVQVLDPETANDLHGPIETLSRELDKGLHLKLSGLNLQVSWVDHPLIGVVEHCKGLSLEQRLAHGDEALQAIEGMGHQLRAPMNIAYFQGSDTARPTLWRKQKAVRMALQNQELELQFAPVFDSVTDALAGFRAELKPLVRHDKVEIRLIHRDIVAISDTLKMADDCTLQILKLALNHCRVWQLLVPGNDMSITVPLDANSLLRRHQDFLDLLDAYEDVADQMLIALEVREESAAADRLPDLNHVIETIHGKSGARFALTEFGMGSLNFQMAQELHVQRIYLANQWPDNGTSNSFDNPVLPELIDLLHTFRIEVVATNVNSEGQLKQLKRAHVDQYEHGTREQPALDEASAIQLIEHHQNTIARTVINAQYRFRNAR